MHQGTLDGHTGRTLFVRLWQAAHNSSATTRVTLMWNVLDSEQHAMWADAERQIADLTSRLEQLLAANQAWANVLGDVQRDRKTLRRVLALATRSPRIHTLKLIDQAVREALVIPVTMPSPTDEVVAAVQATLTEWETDASTLAQQGLPATSATAEILRTCADEIRDVIRKAGLIPAAVERADGDDPAADAQIRADERRFLA